MAWPSGVVREDERSESIWYIFEERESVGLADRLNKQ